MGVVNNYFWLTMASGKDESNPPSLITEYDEPLTPDEAWEAVSTVTEDPKKVALTGEEARREISRYDWEETPSLWKALLDPRKIPCLRETLMAGIIGGAFGMGWSTVKTGTWNKAPKNYLLGFCGISMIHWTFCNFINHRRNKLIRNTINNHPQIMSEKEIIKQVDARMETLKEQNKI